MPTGVDNPGLDGLTWLKAAASWGLGFGGHSSCSLVGKKRHSVEMKLAHWHIINRPEKGSWVVEMAQ